MQQLLSTKWRRPNLDGICFGKVSVIRVRLSVVSFVFVQELAREEEGWAEEMESVDNHRKNLEKKVNHGYDEAVQQLKAAQQQ